MSLTYYAGIGCAGTSPSAPMGVVGTFTVVATWGQSANYVAATAEDTFVISKAVTSSSVPTAPLMPAMPTPYSFTKVSAPIVPPGGQSELPQSPGVSSINTSMGPGSGGVSVTITGVNLANAMRGRFRQQPGDHRERHRLADRRYQPAWCGPLTLR